MSVFKCKMCGGTIEFNPGDTVGICDSCGTKQTLPRLDSDRKTNLYDRANHFRRNNDYDKAMGIYEQILSEDNTDAEAYWSLVLCKYGIEYVEDPLTNKRVPTINRVQYTSIFADEDYKSALKYADGYQKEIYEDEAKAIDEIQKRILSISKEEDPFDVFICYKETDNTGRRTPDSVLANDLYHQLTQEGFKVFFSKITLEDKLGQEYEPYIFAAINSAPVMVCLGTKPEYFNAVWVRNEWSRYLALIKKGEKKVLIPAYKDMDPYDLPDEFSHLQALDMSKLGFMQDLIRGIKKILNVDNTKEKENINSGESYERLANIDRLMKKAFLFIEDGKEEEAGELFDKVIDDDPQNVQAYIGKLILEAGVKTEGELIDSEVVLFDSKNLDRAIRFADDNLKQELTNIKYENAYRNGQKIYERANDERGFELAKSVFEKITDYKDSTTLIDQCIQKGQSLKIEKTYNDAVELMNSATAISSGSIKKLEEAISLFEAIIDYEDSESKIDDCKRRIEKLRASVEVKTKKAKRIGAIAGIAIASIIVITILYKNVIIPSSNYNKAVSMMDEGNYDKAISAFKEMGEYKDVQEKILECQYKKAEGYLADGNYNTAIQVFEKAGDYKDADLKISECQYKLGEACFSSGKYKESMEWFKKIPDYNDAKEKYNESAYQLALSYYEKGDLDNSNPLFEEIKGYKDSSEKIHYHDWVQTSTNEPTCTEKGAIIYSCSCGESKSEDIKALGHDWQAATCTTPKTCKRCGKTSGSALGHTDGVTCERCGEVLFNTLTYSGTGFQSIKDIAVPSGNFLIKANANLSSGKDGHIYVFLYDEDVHYRDSEKVLFTAMDYLYSQNLSTEDQETIKGPLQHGRFDITADDTVSWTITIEAY